MTSRRRFFAPPDRFWRSVAVGAVGLVLMLSAASVSPALHAWLHDGAVEEPSVHRCSHHAESGAPDHEPPSTPGNAGGDHGCGIALFSQGVVYHAGTLTARPAEGFLRAVHDRAFYRLSPAQPRYLHLPPQAPPAA